MYHSLMLLAGMLLLYRSTFLPSVTLILILLLLSLVFWRVNRLRLKPVAVLIVAYCWAGVFAIQDSSENLPKSLINQPVKVLGCLINIKTHSTHYQRLLIDIDETYLDGEIAAFKGKVSLSNYQPLENISPGWCGEFTVKLKPVHGRLNSRGFDYEAWAYVENIKATGVLKSVAELSPGKSLSSHYQRFRFEFSNQLQQQLLNDHTTALVLSLGLGDRSMMTQYQWDLLRRTGTSHLLAISGLHIGLVFWFVSMIISLVWRIMSGTCLVVSAQKLGWVGGLGCSAIYLVLTGLPLSGRRAWVMLFIATGLLLGNEKAGFSRCFSITLMTVLLIWPDSVLSIGFWFSFIAVGLILLQFIHADLRLANQLNWFDHPIVQKLCKLLTIQLVLSMAMLPLSLIFFGELSLISPLANIIAIPFISFVVLPLILVGLFFLSLGAINFSDAVFGLVQSGLGGLSMALEKLLELNWSWSMPVIYQPGSVVILIIGILLWLYLRHWPSKWLLGFLFVPVLVDSKPELQSSEFEMVVFDVGQGLSIWIETRDENLLVDTGFGTKEGFNYVESVIYPVLKANGVKRLDKVIISHGDADHAGGLPALMASDLKPDLIYSSRQLGNTKTRYCKSGIKWKFSGVNFEFMTQNNVFAENNQSCVLKLSSPYGSLLLPGDIEHESERKLLNAHRDNLASDVLVVPHHGSTTSSTKKFIKAVSPELAIFSAGYLNRYNHPADKVIKRYQHYNIKILNTACQGQITVGFYRSGVSVNAIRDSRQPFWRHQC